MNLSGKRAVVTGAGSGIGRALCLALDKSGVEQVICVDVHEAAAKETAKHINGLHRHINVGVEEQVRSLIDSVEDEQGPIDIFVSNAGILIAGGVDVPNSDWQRIWDINVMAHVWAARALIPRMKSRGGGYLLNTASAAGLLNQIGAAPYGVTKHAAVGLAEWLAMSHADDGIKVSVLCPQAVRTEMTRGIEDHVASIDGMLEPEDVAAACIEAIESETFLILPHAQVREYIRLKGENYERWIKGMTKLNRQFRSLPPL